MCIDSGLGTEEPNFPRYYLRRYGIIFYESQLFSAFGLASAQTNET